MASKNILHLDSDDEEFTEKNFRSSKLPRQRQYPPTAMENCTLSIQSSSSSSQRRTHDEIVLERRIGSGLAFISLVTENLLSHPFQVLRRQCQVNPTSRKYHLLPFTLLPTVYRLHQHQGLTILWKGLGSALLVRGITLGVEDFISKVSPWPKEIRWHSSLKQFFQHTLLKCVTFAIVTPFYSASFVETVQSEIASEKPGLLDVFREGFMRLLNWNGGAKGRMLPIWVLIVPTVTLGLSKYLFSIMMKGASVRLLHANYKNKQEANGALPKEVLSESTDNAFVPQDIELTASLITNVTTDIAFYPCETIIHRLYLQGTRTIVDNLDSGQSVLPILTNFTGAIDCYESCLASEGTLGLYKGFGALILQYTVHIALIQLSRFLLTELGNMLHKPRKTIKIMPSQLSLTDISSSAAESNISANTYTSYLLP